MCKYMIEYTMLDIWAFSVYKKKNFPRKHPANIVRGLSKPRHSFLHATAFVHNSRIPSFAHVFRTSKLQLA